MKCRIRWRDSAATQVTALGEYIAADNPRAAIRMASKIRAAVGDQLALMLYMFPADCRNPASRMCALARPYLIYYTVDDAQQLVEIVKVVHAVRDSQR
ncbi:type II toxin-antitoxin system RelE/ParE family toxin [uncultured Cardiobacterium sp.]|uniref:type II toxin-antitoxin system RelE/ParE family toxin n=1 Tax=uncultured Cardiobacterium sp. TaxID=417619 RepID=UPI0026038CAD|nr:type II toxin-antitoxin system RelE/ParE family toxin [uncultured Cardiobacterium sp.]